MNLLALPSELIAHIARHLDDVDVFSVRLGHPNLERACFSLFGQRFFRKRGFLILHASLDVLQSIAEHPELRKYMQHVWFNPDYYTFLPPDCCDDLPDGYELPKIWTEDAARALAPHGRYKEIASFMAHSRQYDKLLNTRELERQLAKAFQGLPNLMTVGMRRSEDYAPYGWRLLKDAIGQDPRVIGPIERQTALQMSGPTCLFVAIVRALAGIDRPLERLYTDAIELERLPAKLLSRINMTAALASMKYVELNIVKGWQSQAGYDSDESDRSESDASNHNWHHNRGHYGQGLVKFFKATPRLLELGLQIFPDQMQSHLVAPTPRDPSSWRRSYAFKAFQRLTSEITLPHLTRIKLEKLTTTSKILSDFLRPCSERLISLKLRDIRLLSSKDEPRPWETMFIFLATKCPRLEHILFYHLMYEQGGISYTEEPPLAPPAETDTDDYIEDPLWPVHAGQAMFAKYDHITMRVDGQEAVRAKLEEIAERHWYHRPLFSYAMDESQWHTDTSDEEW
ncbi:hypothetical protein CLAFUW4_07148 [Fulvia fulva]|uniref:F-box domain-containing protein n=1 Tax=Passalora fulva TaxID=5499 RepID=A0A9Q8UQV6_PASFU|nr:uncharacterized protein CLAFUR5_07282 [Fulvia fulva]KAK4621354.1 hypothetical protein CLAFUR4_07157 [Fulvia fulva]KAK4622809.1 hypothetical protein CLAFUR0_07155 [Fulvia fulva]UJO19060.1 hypothetical protein CLAFUR5_07282 [Fulvia fulva]WPV15938.1 hypothetical protein CLAFUW4_07148 [Fulvia fulva]WPV30999.1 hypothetical protein CLAFUW7_07149 [Fulvia fulva]